VNKYARDKHFRDECKQTHSLTDTEGKIFQMERIEGKFQCPGCQMKYTLTTNLTRHWKKCLRRDSTESNTINPL
jgi:hypothetical protein